MIWVDANTLKGDDITVRKCLEQGSDTLVITFSHRLKIYSQTEGYGEAFLKKRGFDAVHFIAHWSHWWQTPEVATAYACLAGLEIFHHYKRIVVYGASMGGTGALLHGSRFNADAIVVISPIFSIRRKRVPFDRRWLSDEKHVTFIYDEFNDLSVTASITVFFDPFCPPDAKQVALLKEKRSVQTVALSFAGHSAPNYLRDLGLLGDTIADALRGDLDVVGLRRVIRQRRHNSLHFLTGVLQVAVDKGRMGLMSPLSDRVMSLISQKDTEKDRLPIRNAFMALVPALHQMKRFDEIWRLAVIAQKVRGKLILWRRFAAAAESARDLERILKFGALCQVINPGQETPSVAMVAAYKTLREQMPDEESFTERLTTLGLNDAAMPDKLRTFWETVAQS